MAQHHHRIDDEDDDNQRGLLRDGERRRVPLMLMDGWQEDMADHFQRVNDVHVVDAFGQPAGHRPGYCYAAPVAPDSGDALVRHGRSACA